MKKMIFAVAVATTVFWACKNDDNKPSNPLFGEWRVEKSYFNGEEEALEDCDTTEYIVIAQSTLTKHDYALNSSGVCEEQGVFVIPASYTENTITTTIEGEQHTATYTIENNKLIITEEQDLDIQTIVFVRR